MTAEVKLVNLQCMHHIQVVLLNLLKHQNLGSLSLRQIARLIGVDNKPQIIKHHLLQLEKAGLIQVDLESRFIKAIQRNSSPSIFSKSPFYSIPIVGAANCGPANIFAEERIEGYLKISSTMIFPLSKEKIQYLYVLVANGPSMNLAKVRETLTIASGDFVIIDSSYKTPKNNDIIVAVIDNMATIKRYKEDKIHDRIILQAESTEKYLPIFLHQKDDFLISGKVIDVIKKPT